MLWTKVKPWRRIGTLPPTRSFQGAVSECPTEQYKWLRSSDHLVYDNLIETLKLTPTLSPTCTSRWSFGLWLYTWGINPVTVCSLGP